MTRCDGTRTGFSLRCNASLYRCTACGSSGCTQNKPELCSNQAFDVATKCLKCGAVRWASANCSRPRVSASSAA